MAPALPEGSIFTIFYSLQTKLVKITQRSVLSLGNKYDMAPLRPRLSRTPLTPQTERFSILTEANYMPTAMSGGFLHF